MIEFEAEISGFAELLRMLRGYPRPDMEDLPPSRPAAAGMTEAARNAA